jgi:hypothetical protein
MVFRMNPVTDKRNLKWDDMGNCNWCVLKECGKECVPSISQERKIYNIFSSLKERYAVCTRR